jgi:hypothetical protein
VLTYLVQTGPFTTSLCPDATVFAARRPFASWHWAVYAGLPTSLVFTDFLRRLHRDLGETILVTCPQQNLLIDDHSRVWLDRYTGRVRIACLTHPLPSTSGS